MENSKPWQSSTLWANLVMAGVAFFPSVKAVLTPEMMVTAVALVNAIIRVFKTKTAISLK